MRQAPTKTAALAAVAFVAVSLFLGATLGFIGGMACDESCEGDSPPPGADWTDYGDAAQWTVIGRLGVAIAVVGLVSAALVLAGRRRAAIPLVALYGVLAIVTAVFVGPTGNAGFVGLVSIVAVGAGAVMVAGAALKRIP
jgi:hypothetical protein